MTYFRAPAFSLVCVKNANSEPQQADGWQKLPGQATKFVDKLRNSMVI